MTPWTIDIHQIFVFSQMLTNCHLYIVKRANCYSLSEIKDFRKIVVHF